MESKLSRLCSCISLVHLKRQKDSKILSLDKKRFPQRIKRTMINLDRLQAALLLLQASNWFSWEDKKAQQKRLVLEHRRLLFRKGFSFVSVWRTPFWKKVGVQAGISSKSSMKPCEDLTVFDQVLVSPAVWPVKKLLPVGFSDSSCSFRN